MKTTTNTKTLELNSELLAATEEYRKASDTLERRGLKMSTLAIEAGFTVAKLLAPSNANSSATKEEFEVAREWATKLFGPATQALLALSSKSLQQYCVKYLAATAKKAQKRKLNQEEASLVKNCPAWLKACGGDIEQAIPFAEFPQGEPRTIKEWKRYAQQQIGSKLSALRQQLALVENVCPKTGLTEQQREALKADKADKAEQNSDEPSGNAVTQHAKNLLHALQNSDELPLSARKNTTLISYLNEIIEANH